MPTDEKGRKYFMTKENIPKRVFYNIESWVREKEHPDRRYQIDTDDLPHVDFMVLEVWPEDNEDHKEYTTIYGPMSDWEFIEGILGYDFGEEGSRVEFR